MLRRLSWSLRPVTVAVAVVLAVAPVPAARAAPEIEYRFAVATRGPVASDVEAFAATVTAVLNDTRGWALDGRVGFRRVASGGDFTVWLAAASAMRSFGPPCHPRYSCRQGRNVIINEDRWRGGSDPWSGPLSDYRTMVINHETGHWLGFGHAWCPGPGRPAPVMMQQSKGTAGCSPNPWPLPAEREALARRLRVPGAAPSRTVALAGRWTATGDGRVGPDGLGDAPSRSVVAMAATASGAGYWLASTDGGVFAFGDAGFFGSLGGMRLNAPVVGMAPTPSGAGYWLVAGDGGLFSFGDAPFLGSLSGTALNQPIAGIAATPSGGGYWMAGADGGVFSFGDATFLGRPPEKLNQPVVAVAPTPSGSGYWLAAADGGVFTFGDAPFHGAGSPDTVAIAPAGAGYRLATATGAVTSHGP